MLETCHCERQRSNPVILSTNHGDWLRRPDIHYFILKRKVGTPRNDIANPIFDHQKDGESQFFRRLSNHTDP